MLKKLIASVSAFALVLLMSAGFAEAKTITSGKMYKTFEKQISNEHYDYKKGSLKMAHVEEIQLSKPIEVKQGEDTVQVSQITAAVAQYKTVRDDIFFKDFNDYAFFDAEHQVALSTGDVLNIKEIQDYKEKYSSGAKMELGVIGLLLFLTFFIPAIFIFFWAKSQYSTLDFKIKNNLYYGTTTQTF